MPYNHLINSLLALLFIALMAQVTLTTPEALGSIPITGQSLAVLLVGLLLPMPYGGFTVLLYVLLGALGLPIFAEAKSGWQVLRSGSGGFLAGFVVAAFALGWLRQRAWGQHLGWSLLANLLGTAIILAFGVAWLSVLYDFSRALDYGFFPFIEGAIIKIGLGGFIAWSMLRQKPESANPPS
ncbi:MAG: biotin transporter BioY [Bacteroidetes bacterium]|jgi:biotin transport system substrate-specific component|nr:biotin transporter BioY [Bacteroidota bacterium]